MFTGIIEAAGSVLTATQHGSGRTFWLSSAISSELKIDQSISNNGVCLTVEEVSGDSFRVTAILETLRKTTLGEWQPGTTVNLERCLLLNGRLDGHFVQGHIDTTGLCMEKQSLDGSWEFTIAFNSEFAPLIIEKGSICLDGISLTAFDVTTSSFKVAIIPYTYSNTNIRFLEKDNKVNLEFDLIGKYIQRKLSLEPQATPNQWI